ncbi:hypothetical protein GGX14DRAFT_398689 [Mycena pura]|uniref:Fungal-type protein kinase domain-containing protein n=1 Tax=Mycena pura TaxID=153505 RepID=A0AAD6V9K4_9AGAR|nr:hypothetical protein GGX14DRAFT_398689 [Mycena pura]
MPLRDSTNFSDLPPSSSPTPSSPTSQIASLKAANERLETRLRVAQQKAQRKKKSKKRKRNSSPSPTSDDDNDDSPTANRRRTAKTVIGPDYHAYGRDIGRLHGPFLDILAILLHGIKVATDLEYEEEEETRAIISVSQDEDAVEDVACLISGGMDATRGEDGNTARSHIMSIIGQPTVIKVLRGFHNEHTAALLLPPALQHHASDADLHQKVLDGTIKIDGRQLPVFLFPRGRYLTVFQLAKAMYTGPASIFQGDGWRATKPGHAAILRLKQFTPRMVAYIACQARFALSSQHAYNKIDGTFDYDVFFWFIVKAFDREQTRKTVLPLFNKAVLGRAEGLGTDLPAAESSVEQPPAGPDPLELLWAAADVLAAGAVAAA